MPRLAVQTRVGCCQHCLRPCCALHSPQLALGRLDELPSRAQTSAHRLERVFKQIDGQTAPRFDQLEQDAAGLQG